MSSEVQVSADLVEHERGERESMAIMQTCCRRQEQAGRSQETDEEPSVDATKPKIKSYRKTVELQSKLRP